MIVAEFFTIAFIAIIFQNSIVTRGLGSSKEVLMLSSSRGILWFGGFLTVYMLLSALLAWPVYRFLREYGMNWPLGPRYFYSAATLLCSFAVFAALFYVTRAFFPLLHYQLRKLRVLLLFNCAVLGPILIVFSSGDTLMKAFGFQSASNVGYATLSQTLGFALGSGVGYTAALMLVNEGRRRLSLSDVPKAFRGLPVILLYLGIFSLAIYGLIGNHSVTT